MIVVAVGYTYLIWILIQVMWEHQDFSNVGNSVLILTLFGIFKVISKGMVCG